MPQLIRPRRPDEKQDNYNERDARDTWRSFKPGKGVGAGTLFKLAAENGWRMGAEKPQARPMQAPAKAIEPTRKPAAGMSPAEVWERCEPATAAQPYIMAKRGNCEGLRVLPAGDALRIAGESMAGALVLPDGWPQNSDVNDLAQRDGGDLLAELLEAARQPAPPAPRYKLLGADELRNGRLLAVANNQTKSKPAACGFFTSEAGVYLGKLPTQRLRT